MHHVFGLSPHPSVVMAAGLWSAGRAQLSPSLAADLSSIIVRSFPKRRLLPAKSPLDAKGPETARRGSQG